MTKSLRRDIIGEALAASKGQREVPRAQVIEDLLKMLATIHLNDDDAEALYKVIANRVRSATCSKCLKLKAKFEGEMRGTQFVCRDCRFSI